MTTLYHADITFCNFSEFYLVHSLLTDQNLSPCFIVTNLKTSVSFYTDKLGFEIRYIVPDDDSYWAMVGRDNISIMLKAVAPDIKPIPNHTRHEWAPTDAYISAAEPDLLFEEYRSNGVTFRKPVHDNSDNIRGFEWRMLMVTFCFSDDQTYNNVCPRTHYLRL